MIKVPNFEKGKNLVYYLNVGETFICENGVVGMVVHTPWADYEEGANRKIYINLSTGEEFTFDDISEWVTPTNFELIEIKS